MSPTFASAGSTSRERELAQPTITGDGRLLVMSNRGILYAFDLEY